MVISKAISDTSKALSDTGSGLAQTSGNARSGLSIGGVLNSKKSTSDSKTNDSDKNSDDSIDYSVFGKKQGGPGAQTTASSSTLDQRYASNFINNSWGTLGAFAGFGNNRFMPFGAANNAGSASGPSGSGSTSSNTDKSSKSKAQSDVVEVSKSNNGLERNNNDFSRPGNGFSEPGNNFNGSNRGYGGGDSTLRMADGRYKSDPLSDKTITPNMSVFTSSGSRRVAYMTDDGGNMVSALHQEIMGGKSLKQAFSNLNDQIIGEDHPQRLHFSPAVDEKSNEVLNTSKENPASGLAIILVDRSSGEHNQMFDAEARQAQQIAKSLGLESKIVYSEKDFEQALLAGKEKGGDLLMGFLIGHGNNAKQADNDHNKAHDPRDKSFTAIKGDQGGVNHYQEEDIKGDFAEGAKGFKHAVLISGSCHSGGLNHDDDEIAKAKEMLESQRAKNEPETKTPEKNKSEDKIPQETNS